MTSPVRVLAALPTPPPYSGPEINAALMLRGGLGPAIELHHVRTNVHTRNADKGRVRPMSVARLLLVWLRLLTAIVGGRCDVLYIYLSQNRTGFLRDALLVLTGSLMGLRVVGHLRGANFQNFQRDAGPLLKTLIRAVCARLRGVIVVAARLGGQFDALVPTDRIWVVYNAVDPEFVLETLPPCPGASSFRILFVGHLSAAKGFLDLIEALPDVLEACPAATFACAGEWLDEEWNIRRDEQGAAMNDATAARVRSAWDVLCERYGSRVTWLGVLRSREKAAALREAQVFVLPSYSEGFPTVVLEAMGSALPLVVSPVGALPEVLTPGEHAVFVRPGDVPGIAAALIDLAADPDRRCHMGAANWQLVRERFLPDEIGATLASCLTACAAAGR